MMLTIVQFCTMYISGSSDDDKLTHDDMETLLLDYFVKRKTSQQNARRQMWSQLAGLS